MVAHNERATLRVGDVFLKIDPDQTRTDVEVEAMAMAPVPTPKVLWRKPPVLALAALPGRALGRLGEPSTASPAARAAAGAASGCCTTRRCRHGPAGASTRSHRISTANAWLDAFGVLPTDLVTRNRRIAEAALRPWTPVFPHGDLQVDHVVVDGDEITGVIDWSELGRGDAPFDLATLTLGHEEHLGDIVAGYGADVHLHLIRAWSSLRSLCAVRWQVEHGFDPSSPGCEFDALRSRMRGCTSPTATSAVLPGLALCSLRPGTASGGDWLVACKCTVRVDHQDIGRASSRIRRNRSASTGCAPSVKDSTSWMNCTTRNCPRPRPARLPLLASRSAISPVPRSLSASLDVLFGKGRW